ncbi:hypothetical protein J4526_01535 [Desulfurococcaceae archaeon MEX13E-LK6-19]|nr:hypothetical protein J4526_01535 [Desulfurococcaceae archaeon MEX13E-LK6-19]
MGKLCSVSSKIEEVLLALYEKPLSRVELRDKLGLGAQTVTNIAKWLVEKGLVNEVVEGRKVKLVLTEKGKKLAEYVKAIEELIT